MTLAWRVIPPKRIGLRSRFRRSQQQTLPAEQLVALAAAGVADARLIARLWVYWDKRHEVEKPVPLATQWLHGPTRNEKARRKTGLSR
jgi:hypothetical protein